MYSLHNFDFSPKLCVSQRGKTPSGHPLVNSQKIVRPKLHLDESTSHIHVYLVPLDEQKIKGSRSKLLTSKNQKLPHSTTANRKENQDSEYSNKTMV